MVDAGHSRAGSWSVVSTVRAPGVQVAHFVGHHLSLGAERVHLYFDDPQHVWHPCSGHAGRVDTTVCTDDWWTAAGGRPERVEHRQLHNAGHARRATSSEWLLHIDVDEYVDTERPLVSCLAGLEPDVFSVLLPPVEAVYAQEPDSAIDALATPWFRRPSVHWTQQQLELLYSESAHLPRAGLLGHIAGKTLVRVAMDVEMPAIHRPRPVAAASRANLAVPGLSLRHFHALDFADWLDKWQRRASDEVRVKGQQAARLTAAFRSAVESGGCAAARRLYREWYVPGPTRLQRAESLGVVRRLRPV